MALTSIDPATDEAFASYDEMEDAAIDRAVRDCEAAHQAFWRATTFQERGALMKKAASILRERKDAYAELMAREMGKPVKQGRGEVEKCAWACEHYAEKTAHYLADAPIETEYQKSYAAFRPLGVVLAVMPWNFPLWQVFRFAAPALMAGNGGLLKHASNVVGSALAIEDVFRSAGFPEHLFRTLPVSSRKVARIIEHPLVRAATLTGSTPAGRAIASKAGECLKRTVLELGGSDAYVVLEDADIARTVESCVASRMINSGQSCIAAKRFVVVDPVADAFTEGMVEAMRARVIGSPLDEATNVGPQARRDLRDELHEQVQKSIRAGARAALGGERPEGKGAFYPPTVLTHVQKGMPAYEEELFGPVAAIIRVKDEAEAIHVANDSVFGLGAAVFTADAARGERIAKEELQAGCCFVNEFVKSDPRLPFGGIKESGYGRELAAFGIREFVNIKTVVVR